MKNFKSKFEKIITEEVQKLLLEEDINMNLVAPPSHPSVAQVHPDAAEEVACKLVNPLIDLRMTGVTDEDPIAARRFKEDASMKKGETCLAYLGRRSERPLLSDLTTYYRVWLENYKKFVEIGNTPGLVPGLKRKEAEKWFQLRGLDQKVLEKIEEEVIADYKAIEEEVEEYLKVPGHGGGKTNRGAYTDRKGRVWRPTRRPIEQPGGGIKYRLEDKVWEDPRQKPLWLEAQKSMKWSMKQKETARRIKKYSGPAPHDLLKKVSINELFLILDTVAYRITGKKQLEEWGKGRFSAEDYKTKQERELEALIRKNTDKLKTVYRSIGQLMKRASTRKYAESDEKFHHRGLAGVDAKKLIPLREKAEKYETRIKRLNEKLSMLQNGLSLLYSKDLLSGKGIKEILLDPSLLSVVKDQEVISTDEESLEYPPPDAETPVKIEKIFDVLFPKKSNDFLEAVSMPEMLKSEVLEDPRKMKEEKGGAAWAQKMYSTSPFHKAEAEALAAALMAKINSRSLAEGGSLDTGEHNEVAIAFNKRWKKKVSRAPGDVKGVQLTEADRKKAWYLYSQQLYLQNIANAMKLRIRHLNKFGVKPRKITYRDPTEKRSLSTFDEEWAYNLYGDKAKVYTDLKPVSLAEAEAIRLAGSAKAENNEEEFKRQMERAAELRRRFLSRQGWKPGPAAPVRDPWNAPCPEGTSKPTRRSQAEGGGFKIPIPPGCGINSIKKLLKSRGWDPIKIEKYLLDNEYIQPPTESQPFNIEKHMVEPVMESWGHGLRARVNAVMSAAARAIGRRREAMALGAARLAMPGAARLDATRARSYGGVEAPATQGGETAAEKLSTDWDRSVDKSWWQQVLTPCTPAYEGMYGGPLAIKTEVNPYYLRAKESPEQRVNWATYVINTNPDWQTMLNYTLKERATNALNLRINLEIAEAELRLHQGSGLLDKPGDDENTAAKKYGERESSVVGRTFNKIKERFDIAWTMDADTAQALKGYASRMGDHVAGLKARAEVSLPSYLNTLSLEEYEQLRKKSLFGDTHKDLKYGTGAQKLREEMVSIYKEKIGFVRNKRINLPAEIPTVDGRAVHTMKDADGVVSEFEFKTNFDLITASEEILAIAYDNVKRRSVQHIEHPTKAQYAAAVVKASKNWIGGVDELERKIVFSALEIEKQINEIAKEVRYLRCRQFNARTPDIIKGIGERSAAFARHKAQMASQMTDPGSKEAQEKLKTADRKWIHGDACNTEDANLLCIAETEDGSTEARRQRQDEIAGLGAWNVIAKYPEVFHEFWGVPMSEAFFEVGKFLYKHSLGYFVPEEVEIDDETRTAWRSLATADMLHRRSVAGKKLRDQLRLYLGEGPVPKDRMFGGPKVGARYGVHYAMRKVIKGAVKDHEKFSRAWPGTEEAKRLEGNRIKILDAREVEFLSRKPPYNVTRGRVVIVRIPGMRNIAFMQLGAGAWFPVGGQAFAGMEVITVRVAGQTTSRVVSNAVTVGYPQMGGSKGHPFGSISEWLNAEASLIDEELRLARARGIDIIHLHAPAESAVFNEFLSKNSALKERWLSWWNDVYRTLTEPANNVWYKKYQKYLDDVMSRMPASARATEQGFIHWWNTVVLGQGAPAGLAREVNPYILHAQLPDLEFYDASKHTITAENPKPKGAWKAPGSSPADVDRLTGRIIDGQHVHGEFGAPTAGEELPGRAAREVWDEIPEAQDVRNSQLSQRPEGMTEHNWRIQRRARLKQLEKQWVETTKGKRSPLWLWLRRKGRDPKTTQASIDNLWRELAELRQEFHNPPPGFEPPSGRAYRWAKQSMAMFGIAPGQPMDMRKGVLRLAMVGLIPFTMFLDFVQLQNEIDPATGKKYPEGSLWPWIGMFVCALPWADWTIVTTTLVLPIRGFWFASARNPRTFLGARFCSTWGEDLREDGHLKYPQCAITAEARAKAPESEEPGTPYRPTVAATRAGEIEGEGVHVLFPYPVFDSERKVSSTVVDTFFPHKTFEKYKSMTELSSWITMDRAISKAKEIGFDGWKRRCLYPAGDGGDLCKPYSAVISLCRKQSGETIPEAPGMEWAGTSNEEKKRNREAWDETNATCHDWVRNKTRVMGFAIGADTGIAITDKQLNDEKKRRHKSVYNHYFSMLEEYTGKRQIPKFLDTGELKDALVEVRDVVYYFELGQDLTLTKAERAQAKELLYRMATGDARAGADSSTFVSRKKARKSILKDIEQKSQRIKEFWRQHAKLKSENKNTHSLDMERRKVEVEMKKLQDIFNSSEAREHIYIIKSISAHKFWQILDKYWVENISHVEKPVKTKPVTSKTKLEPAEQPVRKKRKKKSRSKDFFN